MHTTFTFPMDLIFGLQYLSHGLLLSPTCSLHFASVLWILTLRTILIVLLAVVRDVIKGQEDVIPTQRLPDSPDHFVFFLLLQIMIELLLSVLGLGMCCCWNGSLMGPGLNGPCYFYFLSFFLTKEMDHAIFFPVEIQHGTAFGQTSDESIYSPDRLQRYSLVSVGSTFHVSNLKWLIILYCVSSWVDES